MRDITEVIDKMLEKIPSEEAELRASLESVKYKAAYTAPEMARRHWADGAEILMRRFGEVLDLPWQEEVCDIWQGVK